MLSRRPLLLKKWHYILRPLPGFPLFAPISWPKTEAERTKIHHH